MIQTASAMGLLRTILIIILVYYAFKILSRIFAPVLLRFMAKKAEEKFGGSFSQQNDKETSEYKEGETVIDKMPNKKKPPKEEVGEYVDYEEID